MFKIAFEKHVPQKKKHLRATHSTFVTKELSKAIMLRSKLRKRFLKDRTEEMFVFIYLKKAKKDYYQNIDISNLTDSNKFWKTVKPILVSKIKSRIALP